MTQNPPSPPADARLRALIGDLLGLSAETPWVEFKRNNADPAMIGKLICHGQTRELAMARMRVALQEIVLTGIKSNIPLHQKLLEDSGFRTGGTNIHYLEKLLNRIQAGS